MVDCDTVTVSRSIDDILSELAAIHDAMRAAPADDHATRADLSNRQDALRQEASRVRSLIPDDASADDLEARIRHLEAEIGGHLDTRPSASASSGAGIGGGGIDPDVLHEMHRAMASSFGLEAKQEELRRLRNRLTELRGD